MTINDLVGKMAVRVSELTEMNRRELIFISPDSFYCENENQRNECHKGITKGRIIESIIVEEFSVEFDREI